MGGCAIIVSDWTICGAKWGEVGLDQVMPSPPNSPLCTNFLPEERNRFAMSGDHEDLGDSSLNEVIDESASVSRRVMRRVVRDALGRRWWLVDRSRVL